MKKSIFIFSAFAMMLTFAACEDKIDLDLPKGETYLVVEGWISNEEGPHDVHLTFTQPYFDAAASPRATGATVFLLDDEGLEALLPETAPGVYSYTDAGVVGRTYILEINLPDGSRYRSEPELLREPVLIDEIFWRISPDGPSDFLDQEPDQIYEVLINTVEPAGLGDNYRWRTYVNGVFKNEPFDIFVTNDDFVDGNPIINFAPVNDLFFLGDTVTIVQERISAAALAFFQLVQAQTAFVGGPFDTPPAPIRSNVLNLDNPQLHARGFFGVAGRDRATVVVGVE